MPLIRNLKRHLLIASAALSLGAGAMETDTSPEQAHETVSFQKVEENSLLNQFLNNQKITYNGLYFDTPLFREKQKTNPDLGDVDFFAEGEETGLKIKDGNKAILVLMPKETVERLIGALIAMDKGEAVISKLSDNPNDWKFHSSYPEILVEENGKRRPIHESELGVIFDKGLAAFTACNSEDIIDAKKMIQKYAQRIGGAKGQALAVSMKALLFKSMQNTLLESFGKGYKKEVVDYLKKFPELSAAERKEFEEQKAKAVALYQLREEKRLQEEQMLAQKEAERQASLIAFNHISDVQIEKNADQTILLFEQGQHRVEINVCQSASLKKSSIFSNVYTYDKNGEQIGLRGLEPEEWKELQKKLPSVLTVEQKRQLGDSFFNGFDQKTQPQLSMIVASLRARS